MTPDQLRECPIDQCAENTDREIYRGPDEGCGDYYSDSLHITQEGALGIDCGGYVIVKPIRTWHGLSKAHAAALEEIERLNAAWKAQQFHLEAEERESAHWQERAEKAERRAERLKDYAEVAMSWIEDKHPDEAKQYLPDFVDAYRADKGG